MKISLIYILIVLSSVAVSCRTNNNNTNEKQSESELVFGEWHFSGHLGNYIDNISEQRILGQEKWDMIYPETEEAFRLREDDKNYPEYGRWRGEFWGKYILSAIATAKYYHSDELKAKIAEAVEGISKLQDENGYIGTYAHSDFLEGNNWNVWTRKYTLWGLLEAWDLLKDDSILQTARRFADNLISEVGPGATDIVKTGNFYGMPSSSILLPIVRLYQATGEQKYLEYAEYIVRQWEKHPEGLPDILNKGLEGIPVHRWFKAPAPYDWAKGYELTSCVEGLASLYEATGNETYLQAAKNIHQVLSDWERTPIGSVSFDDKYVGSAGIINTVSEICDVVYWNRLSLALFKQTGDERYIEEYERSLYNSLLCSYNPEGTWGLRRLRMSHVHVPALNHFLDNHHCCIDNLPRGVLQASDAVLLSGGEGVYLTLFNEGEGTAKLPSGKDMGVKIEGDFLRDSKIRVKLSLDQPEHFKFIIRQPGWSNKTGVKLNGSDCKKEDTSAWLSIDRKWNDGDVLEIAFDIKIRWEFFDSTKMETLHNNIDFYENIWSNIQYVGGSNETLNKRYSNVKKLTIKEALPQQPAVTFFYGPLVLSRDVRITEGDVFAPIRLPGAPQAIEIIPIQAPTGIWKAFELDLGNEQIIKFCDFSSAGNTWNNQSTFNTWCILEKK
ncbi:hypothetical protein GM418_29925 [Maribellus comscasis]|uniref:Glycoside hydrolase family 127 protein n=1 Tax=Maribellus comscasis TaxID=2681766 RepID=A0A6I6JYT0_9BACT|nr:beta-L-arabinofuranosidase domain-containing protein [Maribellus comscasis]QGY47731.1 hypothetical protein GM418_29925 [Maribellus comscasis]